MNLYRNFGYMLENWVADGYPEDSCYSEEASEKHQDASSSDSASACSIRFAGTTLRSESEDSGVDLSNVGSPIASRSSVLTSEDSLTLKQAAVCETEEDTQPLSSPSPSLSSSSSSCFSEAQGSQTQSPQSTAAEQPSVEQALRRNEPDWTQATVRESPVLDAAPRRRCNTTSLTRGLHTATTRTPHRTGSFGSRRPHTQPADQDRLTHTVEQIVGNNGDPVEVVYDVDPNWDGLSPGLLYLERMCRMLEEIARLQQQNKSLQVQMDTIRIQKETASTQKNETSSTFNKKPKTLHLEDQSVLSSHGFRRRTASDTWAFLKHRRKAKAEQFTSTDVLVEEPDCSLEPPVETEQKKASSSLKQRISSLRKNEKTNHSRSSSLHGEKSMLRLFRNRRKTTRL